MSEVPVTRRNDIKWQLLATVSVLALSVSSYIVGAAQADDADHPPLWIELGGQFEQFSREGDSFAPPFISTYDWGASRLTSPAGVQDMRDFSVGGNAGISFQPSGTNWVFSAAMHYGRSNGSRHSHEQPRGPILITRGVYYSGAHFSQPVQEYSSNFQDTKVTNRESHFILDFQAGKDVGLGLFGHGSTSVVGAGVRFAQFTSRATVNVAAREDIQFYNYFGAYPSIFPTQYFIASKHRDFMLSGQSKRSFHGLGPSLTWNASVPFVGSEEKGEATFDWRANVAVLFGRQKADVQHQSSGHYFRAKYGNSVLYINPLTNHPRARSVIVPDVGGFAGLSFRYADAKLSLGYRADFFFGAMDTGIDTRKTETVGFYGPFASISIGIGG